MSLNQSARSFRGLVVPGLIFLATMAYIWFATGWARFTVLGIAAAVFFFWELRLETPKSLGLSLPGIACALRRWRPLWLGCTALFLLLGRNILFHWRIFESGVLYFVWCCVQQVVFQSVVYLPLRDVWPRRWPAIVISGIVFALVHMPNPVLIAGTLVWGMLSAFLFERCRTVWGLALLQVMLSSMLMWMTPYRLNHGFRIGPSYYRAPLVSPRTDIP